MWLFFALAAYVIFAAVTITDKYLLTRPIPDARVYSFYVGVLGIFIFLLAPFGFQIPPAPVLVFGLFAGALFVAALFLFFSALRIGEVSRIGISFGGLVPFFTLLFIYIGTGEVPSRLEFVAFGLLVTGSAIIILERFVTLLHHMKQFGLVLAASLLFGLYFAIAKFLFAVQPFISAFIWIKVGGVLFALVFLLSPQVRKMLFEHKKSPPKKTGGIFFIKNIVGGGAALLQHAAISSAGFAQVALVSALQGVQFALVFFIALFLTRRFPGIVKERIDREAIIVKSVGTGFIVAGIVILAMA